jgi:hypothetical protein
MHFHLPKPLHGWRAFVGEVGIIVVGVLIALSAEQVVERWHWDEQVRAGREALRDDFRQTVFDAEERKAEDPCIRRRLFQLRQFLDDHPDALPALGHVGSPPARPWYPLSWDSLVASDVTTHLPREQMLKLSSIAQQARQAEDVANQEIREWAVIYTMVGPARQLGSGEAAQIRKAISLAAYELNEMRLVAPQIEWEVLSTGLLTRDDLAEVRAELRETLRGPNATHICGPISPPDAARVDAPYDPAVQTNPLLGKDDTALKDRR